MVQTETRAGKSCAHKFGIFRILIAIAVAGTWTAFSHQSASAQTTTSWVDISNGGMSTEIDALATDKNGNLYAVGTGNNTVLERPVGSSTWQDITNGGAFDGPGGIAVDNSGDIFVANWDNDTVLERPTGSSTWQDITNGGAFQGPYGVAADNAGNVYVSNGSGTILERKAGTTSWINITGNGNFNVAGDVAVDASGNLYVVDSNDSIIFERKAGSTTWMNINNGADMNIPEGIASDGAGDLFVVNTDGNTVLERPAGSTTWTDISGNATPNGPCGVAVDGTGHVYIVNKLQAVIEESLVTSPTLTGSTTDSNHTVDLTYTDDPAWDSAISAVDIDGKPISTSDYTKSAGKITIKAGILDVGTHTITVVASGYTDATTSATVTLAVPTGLSHTSVTEAGWTESWTSVNGATGYNVYVNGTKVNSSPVSSTQYVVSGMGAKTPYTVAVSAVNVQGETAKSGVDTVTTSAPLTISTTPTLDLVSGSAYKGTFTASGGTAPYTFSLASGELPKGLSLSSDGTLHGTTTASGPHSVTVKVTDGIGAYVQKTVTLYIVPHAPAEALGIVKAEAIVDASGKAMTSTSGNSSASLDIPAGAFTTPVQVNVTTGKVSPKLLGSNLTYVTAFGVNFAGTNTPQKPLVLTIRNAGITAHSVVYKILNGKLIPVHAVVTNGKAVLSFTTDPDFVVVNAKSSTVAGATSPVTGKPFMWNYIYGSLAVILGGGLLLISRKKQKMN